MTFWNRKTVLQIENCIEYRSTPVSTNRSTSSIRKQKQSSPCKIYRSFLDWAFVKRCQLVFHRTSWIHCWKFILGINSLSTFLSFKHWLNVEKCVSFCLLFYFYQTICNLNQLLYVYLFPRKLFIDWRMYIEWSFYKGIRSVRSSNALNVNLCGVIRESQTHLTATVLDTHLSGALWQVYIILSIISQSMLISIRSKAFETLNARALIFISLVFHLRRLNCVLF